MRGRSFVRIGPVLVAGLVFASTVACGGGPTDPGGEGQGPPTLRSIDPDSGAVGLAENVVEVALTGTNFDEEGTSVEVSGPGVEVRNVSVVSSTVLTADFAISGDAPTGERDVTVSTEAGASDSRTFRVVAGGGDPDLFIEIENGGFTTLRLQVEVGDTVTWQNVSDFDHTVSPYGHMEWEGVLLGPNEVFRHEFDRPGEFGFICNIHLIEGTITVVEPEAAETAGVASYAVIPSRGRKSGDP